MELYDDWFKTLLDRTARRSVERQQRVEPVLNLRYQQADRLRVVTGQVRPDSMVDDTAESHGEGN